MKHMVDDPAGMLALSIHWLFELFKRAALPRRNRILVTFRVSKHRGQAKLETRLFLPFRDNQLYLSTRDNHKLINL